MLSFASLSVRPLFLSIYESHILKLGGAALRPALKAIILSLLPGLEDETSEDFERMVSALEMLRKVVQGHAEDVADSKSNSGSSHFWQCFFLATITNSSRRQGALAFLVRRLPKFGRSERRSHASETSDRGRALSAEAEAAISPEPGLLIRCFESGLADPQLLIQRGFLDLLVSHLPLDSSVLQERIGAGDLERLVAAAAGVVSRRDMSLNRRLWAWFLGPEPTASETSETVTSPVADKSAFVDPSNHQAAFFSQFGLEALTNSVLKMINRRSAMPADRARPFRVCLSLMDRWEVGGLIIPEVFVPALQSVQSYSEVAPKEHADEVMRSASAFFDGVDSGLIWGKLIDLVTSSLQSDGAHVDEALRRMKLAKFVLARFNLKEEEMLLHHMPLMVFSVLASLNDAFERRGGTPLNGGLLSLALEIADSLIQVLPDHAIKDDQASEQEISAAVKISRVTALQHLRAFYDETQGSLEAVDPPFQPIQLGQLISREASRTFMTSIRSADLLDSPDMPCRILSNSILKTQQSWTIDYDDFVTSFGDVLAVTQDEGGSLAFPQLSAMTTVLSTLQTSRHSEPYIASAQLAELVYPLITRLWQYLSPTMPKYHVETARCMLQLHAIAPASRMVESAISSIIVAQSSQNSTSSNASDFARRFATLWTHILHELGVQFEKRVSMTRRPSGISVLPISLPPGEFHCILTRPLLLLLDVLEEEGVEVSAFVRSWLQDLPSLDKVFAILRHHIQSLHCLSATSNLELEAIANKPQTLSRKDDTKECLYYMKHFFNILKHPSHLTWVTLSEVPVVSWAKQPSSLITIQEWLVRICLETLSMQSSVPEMNIESHIQELHRISVAIITQILKSGFATSLRDLELEIPLMARLKTAGPSLQSLLLAAELSALKLRLNRPQQTISESTAPNHPVQRSRMSLALNRDSEESEPAPVPPPSQLVECLKHGFSSATSRLVLDDWIQFLIDVLPMFADTIFQNLLPLVECLCQQINVTFRDLKSTFTKEATWSSTSPETTLISLINGLEQILAKAHERLMTQETKATAVKSPEQPHGFFSNVVSGVFSSDTSQTRAPTANSRLTVLLCFQDTVRICFDIWSWGGYGQNQEQQDPTSASSFGYTSLRMRNRARRILEHLFAAEALECLETLAVLWARAPRDDVRGTAITGLLNVLNGSKPKHTIPAIFNAVYSRTDPGALDANRLSTLTSDLTDTELVAFLVEYTVSLEDDAMDEIWQDCSLFLRDVLANPLPHRQILPTLLEFTSVIGQKVDNTNFGEQRRMRRELAVSNHRAVMSLILTVHVGHLRKDTDRDLHDALNGILAGHTSCQR